MLDVVKILYQDASLALVRKPANLHTLKSKPSEKSLVTELEKLFPQLTDDSGNLKEKVLLQRLDFETGGIVLLAKNDLCFDRLKQQFKNHEINKTYYALLDGRLKEAQKLQGYLGSRYRSSKKASFSKVKQDRYLFAETEYQPVRYFPEYQVTLVKALTNYGRRHQVRLMAATLGYPLCGDKLYGSKNSTKDLFPELNLPAFLLEACQLSFNDPDTKNNVSYTGELPDYLVKLLHYDKP